jgi:hypothetical protein
MTMKYVDLLTMSRRAVAEIFRSAGGRHNDFLASRAEIGGDVASRVEIGGDIDGGIREGQEDCQGRPQGRLIVSQNTRSGAGLGAALQGERQMFELGMAERLFRVIEYLRRPQGETWASLEPLEGVAIDPEARHYDEPLETTLNILDGWAGRYAELAANEAMVPRDLEEDAYREVSFADGQDACDAAFRESTPEQRAVGFIQFKFRGRLWTIHRVGKDSSGTEVWSDPELNPFRASTPKVLKNPWKDKTQTACRYCGEVHEID